MAPHLWLTILLAAVVSSFTVTLAAEEISKSEDVTTTDDSSSQEDSKEKRSQEEIMFGNQQNKPNGLVDDLMSMSENAEDASNGSQGTESKADPSLEDKKETSPQEVGSQSEDMMVASGPDNWYSSLPASASALQYITNAQALKSLPPEALSNGLYDQEDLYRRKRQLLEHPMPMRSLRSSLGQMIQKRGIRMPRRSMRLKRQVDVEDLLNLLGDERYYNEEVTSPHIFSGRARTVAKRHVPGRYNAYQEKPEFRYPYVFQHRDDGILSSAKNTDDGTIDNEAIDELLMLPPNSRYVETPQDLDLIPYRTREEENEDIQKWLNRHTVPSVFRVARRSAPFFYPIDYRYIPGYKKRSPGERREHISDESEMGEFGKWGHVVQVPEAYTSPEDIARLYGLANLLSEGDDLRIRRAS